MRFRSQRRDGAQTVGWAAGVLALVSCCAWTGERIPIPRWDGSTRCCCSWPCWQPRSCIPWVGYYITAGLFVFACGLLLGYPHRARRSGVGDLAAFHISCSTGCSQFRYPQASSSLD